MLELPDKVTAVVEQVSAPLTLAVAPGAVLFCVTVTVVLAVHPEPEPADTVNV